LHHLLYVLFRIKKELMTLVTSLSQDVDYEVRACMCQELEPVARALGYDVNIYIITMHSTYY